MKIMQLKHCDLHPKNIMLERNTNPTTIRMFDRELDST